MNDCDTTAVWEINKAIALAIGWRCTDDAWYSPNGDGYARNYCRSVIGLGETIDIPDDSILPNYCENLNAMHEVEKTLTESQRYVFGGWINQITKGGCFTSIHATAFHRVKAYLKTIDKWKPQWDTVSSDL